MKKVVQPTLREAIDAYMATNAEDYDWVRHWDEDRDSSEDLFRACITTEPVQEGEEYYACGSVGAGVKTYRPNNIDVTTPIALYRLLYLVQPESVDFSDMYKTTLFFFRSSDKRFLVEVDLFKYELGLYFYCVRDAIGGRQHGVTAGAPGADNGTYCADEVGQAFFAMVKHAVGEEWDVYSGNHFAV